MSRVGVHISTTGVVGRRHAGTCRKRPAGDSDGDDCGTESPQSERRHRTACQGCGCRFRTGEFAGSEIVEDAVKVVPQVLGRLVALLRILFSARSRCARSRAAARDGARQRPRRVLEDRG